MQGVLTINLAALAENYRLIQSRVGQGCRVAAVVKANAYGCGLAACAQALEEAGARDFFVATLPEALELRTIIGPSSAIHTLEGFDDSHASLYPEEEIIPVLSSLEQLALYRALAESRGERLPALLHFDTGINRLGIRFSEYRPALAQGLDIRGIMSHFACSDEAGHALNAAQVSAFETIRSAFPGAAATLANSSAVFHYPAAHLDLVRPGMALYGLNPVPGAPNPMRPVVSLGLPVIQTKTALAGESCGYGATHLFDQDTPLAILGGGYADGLLRSLSNSGRVYWNGTPCPIRGRVSMDLTIVDLSAVPAGQRPQAGDMMEVIGPHQSADDLAGGAGTIGYEILTSLSRRYRRVYQP
jgi:alanine racemase